MRSTDEGTQRIVLQDEDLRTQSEFIKLIFRIVEDSRFGLTRIKMRDCGSYHDRYRKIFKNKKELFEGYDDYRFKKLGMISVEGRLDDRFVDLTLRVSDKKIIADTSREVNVTAFLDELIDEI